MSFQIYGKVVSSVSIREWWGWQKTIFGNVFGWTPSIYDDVLNGRLVDKMELEDADLIRILSLGTETSEDVDLPDPDDNSDWYDDDEKGPSVSQAAFEQLERTIALGLFWKELLESEKRDNKVLLPEWGETMTQFVQRIQTPEVRQGLESPLRMLECGVPPEDIFGYGDYPEEMHYVFVNWHIRLS